MPQMQDLFAHHSTKTMKASKLKNYKEAVEKAVFERNLVSLKELEEKMKTGELYKDDKPEAGTKNEGNVRITADGRKIPMVDP